MFTVVGYKNQDLNIIVNIQDKHYTYQHYIEYKNQQKLLAHFSGIFDKCLTKSLNKIT